MKIPVVSQNFTLNNDESSIVQSQFGQLLKDTENKDWSKFFIDDLSKKLKQYKSTIPQNILSRPEQVREMMACLGVQRVDLPKMPNGNHVTWWYFLQFKSCLSCVYLSKKDASYPLKRKCLNPKIQFPEFIVYSSSLDTCTHWRAGYDDERIEEQKSMGMNESSFIWASLVALGISEKPTTLLLPMVGIPQIFRATPEVIHATEIHNSIIYDYLQLYYLKQAGYKIDDEEFQSAPLENLPIIKAENFDTNVVQSGVMI
ncbi:MAG: hypothetical protein EBR94_01260 [Bacteroidetes bacterium]|nr:hypothetical protein [Bacteroidota bacterium]